MGLTSFSWSKCVAWCSHRRRPVRCRTTSCMLGLVLVSSRYHFPTKSFISSGIESFLGFLSPFAQHSLSSLASSNCLRWLPLKTALLLRPMHFPAPSMLDPEVVDPTATSTTFLATYISLPFPNFNWSQAPAILSQTASHPNNFLRFSTYSGMTCCRAVLHKMFSTTIFWNSNPLVLVSCNKDTAQFLPNRDAAFVEDDCPSWGVPGHSELDVCSKVLECVSDCNIKLCWCFLCFALFLRLDCVFWILLAARAANAALLCSPRCWRVRLFPIVSSTMMFRLRSFLYQMVVHMFSPNICGFLCRLTNNKVAMVMNQYYPSNHWNLKTPSSPYQAQKTWKQVYSTSKHEVCNTIMYNSVRQVLTGFAGIYCALGRFHKVSRALSLGFDPFPRRTHHQFINWQIVILCNLSSAQQIHVDLKGVSHWPFSTPKILRGGVWGGAWVLRLQIHSTQHIMGFIQYTTQNAQTENVRVHPPEELHDFEVTVKENECSRV